MGSAPVASGDGGCGAVAIGVGVGAGRVGTGIWAKGGAGITARGAGSGSLGGGTGRASGAIGVVTSGCARGALGPGGVGVSSDSTSAGAAGAGIRSATVGSISGRGCGRRGSSPSATGSNSTMVVGRVGGSLGMRSSAYIANSTTPTPAAMPTAAHGNKRRPEAASSSRPRVSASGRSRLTVGCSRLTWRGRGPPPASWSQVRDGCCTSRAWRSGRLPLAHSRSSSSSCGEA